MIMGLQLDSLPYVRWLVISHLGSYVSIRYHHSSFKQLVRDFFQVKQAPLNYLLVLIFIGLDFLPQVFSGEIIIPTWYLPIILFVKALVFGGIEEIG